MNAQGRLRVRDQIEIYTKSKVQQRKPFSFLFFLHFTAAAFGQERRNKSKRVGGKKKNVRARISDLLNKAYCSTGVLGAFTQQCAVMRAAAAALLCNFNLCNTPTTYTHSVQYLSWRGLDNAVTTKGRCRQTPHPRAVLSHFKSYGVTCLPLAKPHAATVEASCTKRALSSIWIWTVFWSPQLLTRPLVAPLV